MDWSNIIVAAMALVGTMSGTYFSNRRSAIKIDYRLEGLEKRVDKHNSVIERTYKLEQEVAVIDEKVKVANNRIKDLEGQV